MTVTDAGDVPVSRDRMRAADADRERVIERLRIAHGEGRLDIHEFDERVAAVWRAQTYGELDALTRDLPPETATPSPAVPGTVSRSAESHSPARSAWEAWLAVSVLNVGIWAIVCFTAGEWIYPWWVWIAGPWGLVLLVSRLTDR